MIKLNAVGLLSPRQLQLILELLHLDAQVLVFDQQLLVALLPLLAAQPLRRAPERAFAVRAPI